MDSDPLNRFYEPRTASDWDGIKNLREDLLKTRGQWIFRGLPDACWSLVTTLDQAAGLHRPGGPLTFPRNMIRRLEGGILRAFKRRGTQYLQKTPDDDNVLEWLALMRHYGAPSRLQDWTYSFYIAVFFALDRSDGEAALWALDSDWVASRIKALLGDKIYNRLTVVDRNVETSKTFTMAFARRKPIPLACAVNPYQLNPRLAAQQGLFLCPGDVAQPFHKNLGALFQTRRPNGKLIKCVIALDARERKRVMEELYRMNITSTTLFPGLDGFAHSLEHMMSALPDVLVPDTFWPER